MSKFSSASPRSVARWRSVTFLLVAAAHVCVVLGPLWLGSLAGKKKPKEEMFRVKIGGKVLSQGPQVGMPERQVRPLSPPPAEPDIPRVTPRPKAVPEPQIPRVKPKTVVKPKPKPVVKPKPKPVVKPKPKLVVKPRPKPVVKPRPRPAVKPKPVVKPRPKPVVKPRRPDPLDDVYRDDTPRNNNFNVPAGSRNRSQQYAPKHDNRTPGGGKKADEAAFVRYGKNVERYIYSRWVEPPRSLLQGEFPETVIELTIRADGRVSRAEIVRASGNRPMEASVKALLDHLDLLPRPPEGDVTFRITLKTR
jgi:TonB family protein